jgi:hypothetical protein
VQGQRIRALQSVLIQAGDHVERQHDPSPPAIGAGDIHSDMGASGEHDPFGKLLAFDRAGVVTRNVHRVPETLFPSGYDM